MSKDPLLFDVGHVRDRESRVERSYRAEQLARDAGGQAQDESYRVIAPVELAFDVHKDNRHFRLTGRVSTTLEVTCGRCLEPFQRDVDEAFDLLYLPQSENKGEGELEIEGEDLSTAYYQGEVIDLWQLMREQFYLSLPMKLLCSDACRGLCPDCGTNLNLRTCDCRHDWDDPRLAVLRTLLDEKNHA